MHPKLIVALTLNLAVVSPSIAQDTATTPAVAAAPGTEAGAKALASDLAPYLSQTAFDRKYVTVTPETAGYRITMNLDGLLDQLKFDGAKFDIDPISAVVSERPDGNWDVSSNDPLNMAFDITAENIRQSLSYKIDVDTFTGVFSPTLGNFLTGSGSYKGGTMQSSDAQSDMTARFGRTTYEMIGKETVPGTLDYTLTQTIADFTETVTMKPGELGTEPVAITFGSKDSDVSGSATGFKSRAVMDLWAFAVVHAEKGEVPAASEDTLKQLLNAALPLWSAVDGRYDINDLTVTFPTGQATVDTLSLDFATDGISRSGTLGYSFGFKGLDVKSSMIPAWAAGLLPQDFELRTKVVDLDLDTPARLAIADLDLTRDKPISDEVGAKIAQGFENAPPRLLIEPSRLKSQDLDMTVEGDFLFSGAQPEMTMKIEAAGMDAAMAKLRSAAATEPSINEALGGLALAQGFGKKLPDGRLQWLIATKADGSVSLNGNQLVPPTPAIPETDPADAPTDENAFPELQEPMPILPR